MILPEEVFLKELEAYFIFDLEFNDSAKRKVLFLLEEYKKSINVEIKVVTKNFIIYKTIAGNLVKPHTNKKILSYSDLEDEFNKFCKNEGVTLNHLIKKQGRSTRAITKIKVDFCNYIAENFLVSKAELAAFFGLNHATIHYYFKEEKK
tara:strand:+ start:523 stop:969 length:447 start_codon:yes stop_codon:yes gene_type:complete